MRNTPLMESHGNYFGQHQKCPDLRLRNLKLNSRTSPDRDSWNLCSNIILRSRALTNCSLLSNCQNADQSISIQLPSSLHQAFENSKAFCSMFYVYIIYSTSTATFYKGQTDNLHSRLKRHNAGYEKYNR